MHGDYMYKSLPSSVETEAMILGAILIDNTLMSQCVGHLEAMDFYSPTHQRVFEAMLVLHEGSQPIDPILIGTEIKKAGGNLDALGGVSIIASLSLGVPFFTDLTEHVKVVKQASRKRKLVKICGYTSDDALSDTEDIDALLDRHEQLMFELRKDTQGEGWSDLARAGFDTTKRLHEFGQNPQNALLGITTGYKDLDARTSGFEKGDLIILGARPSMGKTACALRMAFKAAISEAKPVVAVFSLEMTTDQVVQRLIATEAGVDLMRLRRGHLSSAEWGRVKYANEQFQQCRYKIDDTPALTTVQIKARARALMTQEERLDLIVVDHLGLIRHSDERKNRHLQISDHTKALKAMAKDLEVPVIALCQLNREVEKRPSKKPQMSDLMESGSIEADADIVMFLFRKSYYFPEDKDAEGVAEVIFGKVRNGPTGTDKLTFISHFARFDDYVR